MQNALIVLLGPTGVGKTDLSIDIAKEFHTEIVSCDSRQFYKEMKIGTAVPSDEQLAAVKHYFIQNMSVTDYFNSWQFEVEGLKVIRSLIQEKGIALMTGGSMMYIDAICKGIDDIPTISPELRAELMSLYEEKGLSYFQELLKELDPDFYQQVDLNNGKRVLHAVEVCKMAGVPYSTLRTGMKRDRGFKIILIGLNRDKEELYDRINHRVDIMIDEGLEEEVRSVEKYREYNALNTVGYKEFFSYFDGEIPYEEAVRLVKRNSRRYAKKQLSWFRRDEEITWFHPDQKKEIIHFIHQQLLI